MRLLLNPDPIPAGPRGGASAGQDSLDSASVAGERAVRGAIMVGGAGQRTLVGTGARESVSAACERPSDGLQYLLGWYSLVAPALGLPAPTALWTG